MIEHRVRTANPLIRRRLAALDGGDHVQEVNPVEGFAAGEQLVEHASEREDVGTLVAGVAVELLRRHVPESCLSRRQTPTAH